MDYNEGIADFLLVINQNNIFVNKPKQAIVMISIIESNPHCLGACFKWMVNWVVHVLNTVPL